MPSSGHLAGVIKHYDWGGSRFIPELLDDPNPGKKPYAEYWLGTHPQAPCYIKQDDSRSIRQLIQENPVAWLGEKAARKFNDLPYLLKVLDVSEMLSIQVHPSKKNAIAGFEKENQLGLPLDDPHRNYKDQNHKPELMVALSEFWLLHGFRTEADTRRLLKSIPEFNGLVPVFDAGKRKGLFTFVMEMPQSLVDSILNPLIKRISDIYKNEKPDKDDPSWWAARAAEKYNRAHCDRGIFCIYLLQLLRLQKGQGVFQAAGVPHAYLEGQNIEIMATSDNVLRGGLTTKHIDIPELLANTDCDREQHGILNQMSKNGFDIFETPVKDFSLARVSMDKGDQLEFETKSCEILLLTEGKVEAVFPKANLVLEKGSPACIVPAGTGISLKGLAGSLVFRASIPDDEDVHRGE